MVSKEPTIQPHGRLSWNICWGGNPFIDLSVMPPMDVPAEGAISKSAEIRKAVEAFGREMEAAIPEIIEAVKNRRMQR